MQTIFQKGKNYLKIDLSYLSNFVEGIKYRLVFEQDCKTDVSEADTELCNSTVTLSFELVRCIPKDGVWNVSITDIDSGNVIHQLFVQVYNLK